MEAESSVDVVVTYVPSNIMKDPQDPGSDGVFNATKYRDSNSRYDEEKIVLKVTDGMDQQVKCVGMVSDPKCSLVTGSLELGEVSVCKEVRAVFSIKNASRQSSVLKVLRETVPYQCSVQPMSGKIGGEEKKDFTVEFTSTSERYIDTNVIVMLRSGRVLRLPFSIRFIVPELQIVEADFDFGQVTTLGNQGSLPLTLVNCSGIDAEVIFDLRGEELNPSAADGVQCLELVQLGEDDLLKSIMEDDEEQEKQKELDDSLEVKHVVKVKQNKKFFLRVPAATTLKFLLKMAPKEIKKYAFKLPLYLSQYGPIPALDKKVTCQGSKPTFLIDPQVVDFGRKIILTPPDKNVPAVKELLLSNPEYYSTSFKLGDLPDKTFSVVPTLGRVDGGQTLSLKIMFNPRYQGDYSTTLPIYLEGLDKPYMNIIFKGTAALPRLLFDRREVILPPVPLNIETRTVFKIINDGYESIKIQAKPIQGFTLEFLDGMTLGITKSSISILVKFQSKHTLSITQILDIIDEQQNGYQIALSATTDNCSLTNYPYLTSHAGSYLIDFQNTNDPLKASLILNEVNEEQEEGSESGSNLKVEETNRVSTKMLGTHVSFQEDCATKEAS